MVTCFHRQNENEMMVFLETKQKISQCIDLLFKGTEREESDIKQ
jgi:hypothetical protein